MKRTRLIFAAIHLAVVMVFGLFIYWKFFRDSGDMKEPVPEAVAINTLMDANNSEAGVLGNNVLGNNALNNNGAVTASTSETMQTGLMQANGPAGSSISVELKLPKELNLDIPFYAQAPYANWDMPWQEACEEASILLVANAVNKYEWDREQFKDEILKLVDWEKKTFGDYKHTTVEQTARMLKENFGIDSVIKENPTFDDVKLALAKGHPVVMMFAGKYIGNPNYKNGGPVYHAMVIKGYKDDQEKLITNDVGTRKGADWVYNWKTLQNALHDWDEPIENGAKRMLEVIPPNTKTNGTDSSTAG